MQNVGRKVMGTVISAVLLLYMAFPITDFHKPERAYANPGVLVVLGTIAAAGGVVIGGATLTQYNANLQAVYDGFGGFSNQWTSSWQQYVQDQGSFDNALNSFVTANGEISLQTVSDSGFFDSMRSYSVYCVQHGTMVEGSSSALANLTRTSFTVNNYEFPFFDNMPGVFSSNAFTGNSLVQNNMNKGRVIIAYKVSSQSNGLPTYSVMFGNPSTTYRMQFNEIDGEKVLNFYTAQVVVVLQENQQGGFASSSQTTDKGQIWEVGSSRVGFELSPSLDYTVDGSNSSVSEGSVYTSAVAPEVVNGSAVLPTETVQPFQPTAEQLANGYTTADVLDAINSGNEQTNANLGSILSAITTTIGGVLNDIKTGVNGLETTIGNALTGALGSVLSGISTTVGTVSTTLGDIWGGVQGWYTDWLAWVGATPLGQLIAQIIAALQAGVISLSQAIAAVQTAVQTAVTDLVGAIESIQIPTFELPSVTLPYANLNGGSGTADLMDGSAAHVSAFQSLLNDKEPFCYLFAFSNGMQQVQANNSAARFRIQHRFDILGQPLDVDINAEPYLLRDVGGTTIADLLRSSMTLTLCMGLLYSAYRTALRAVKS